METTCKQLCDRSEHLSEALTKRVDVVQVVAMHLQHLEQWLTTTRSEHLRGLRRITPM